MKKGILGSIFTGIFASKTVNPLGKDGLVYSHDASLLGAQVLSVLIVIGISSAATIVILFPLRFLSKQSQKFSPLEGEDATDEQRYQTESYDWGDIRYEKNIPFADDEQPINESHRLISRNSLKL